MKRILTLALIAALAGCSREPSTPSETGDAGPPAAAVPESAVSTAPEVVVESERTAVPDPPKLAEPTVDAEGPEPGPPHAGPGLFGPPSLSPSESEPRSIPGLSSKRISEELAARGYAVETRPAPRDLVQRRCVRRSEETSVEVVLSARDETGVLLAVATVVDLSADPAGGADPAAAVKAFEELSTVLTPGDAGPAARAWIGSYAGGDAAAEFGGATFRLEAEGPRVFSLTLLPPVGENGGAAEASGGVAVP